MAAVVQAIANSAAWRLGDTAAAPLAREILLGPGVLVGLESFLTRWCAQSTQPLVLLLDEVDALVGDTLISLLRQLRADYEQRPHHFPQTVILCGVRDLRDYRIHSSAEAAVITGGSAFNIKAKSLRLGDFTAAEVNTLLQEHTTETGQVFTPAAVARVWELTRGQPWLVNALAYEACFDRPAGRDRGRPITLELIDEAKECLIVNRVTHLDQLADKLREPRVRQVIEPMLAGTVGLSASGTIRILPGIGRFQSLCRHHGRATCHSSHPGHRSNDLGILHDGRDCRDHDRNEPVRSRARMATVRPRHAGSVLRGAAVARQLH